MSFEYVIVAACVVGAVVAAFGTGAGGAIGTALTGAINGIVGMITAATCTAVRLQRGAMCPPPFMDFSAASAE